MKQKTDGLTSKKCNTNNQLIRKRDKNMGKEGVKKEYETAAIWKKETTEKQKEKNRREKRKKKQKKMNRKNG